MPIKTDSEICQEITSNMERELTQVENTFLSSPQRNQLDDILEEGEFQELEMSIRRLQRGCGVI
jgi:hypothetical protein